MDAHPGDKNDAPVTPADRRETVMRPQPALLAFGRSSSVRTHIVGSDPDARPEYRYGSGRSSRANTRVAD